MESRVTEEFVNGRKTFFLNIKQDDGSWKNTFNSTSMEECFNELHNLRRLKNNEKVARQIMENFKPVVIDALEKKFKNGLNRGCFDFSDEEQMFQCKALLCASLKALDRDFEYPKHLPKRRSWAKLKNNFRFFI